MILEVKTTSGELKETRLKYIFQFQCSSTPKSDKYNWILGVVLIPYDITNFTQSLSTANQYEKKSFLINFCT